MRISLPFIAGVVWGICFASVAQAQEPIRLHLGIGASKAISAPQNRELGWGAAAVGAVERPLIPQAGALFEVGNLWLQDGKPPLDPKYADQGSGSALFGALGIRLAPWNTRPPRRALGLGGLWISGSGGITRTGGLLRPLVNAGFGWDIFFREGVLGAGPAINYLHVFQPDNQVRPEDANIVTLGLHGVFDWARPKPAKVDGDRDGDGIRDSVDRCPDVAEDKDGFEDSDGCPELDNDRDGIPDVTDHCPLIPEDRDQYEDEDGCPDLDNDKDGILDPQDHCPLEPEDLDHFEDEDGCPDPDNDKDGIPDLSDLCPNEPETLNGYADQDGCPDEDRVRVIGDKIVLDDRVHFRVNNAGIRPESFFLLGKLAKLLREHPEYVHIHIEGHADPRGSDTFNQQLSEGRARSVLDFLAANGVDISRLSSEGHGESKPQAQGQDEYSYYLDRRVEFTVTRAMKPGTEASLPTSTGAASDLPPEFQQIPEAPAPPPTQSSPEPRESRGSE